MKNIFLIVLIIVLSLSVKSQDSLKTESKSFVFDVSGGGVMSSFQDRKYSDLKFTGFGANYGFNLEWRKKSIIGFGINGIYSKQKPKNFEGGEASINAAQFYFKYLYPVDVSQNFDLFVGAKADLFDGTMRISQGLTNNSAYIIVGGGLKAFAMIEKQLNDKWLMTADLGFQLFALQDEYMSFAYMANQKILESGEYNYEDPAMPLFFTPFWQYINIETNIRFHYGKRWIFSYLWRMQQSYQVKGYPMTKGYSAVSVGFKIMNRNKAVSK